MKLTQTSKILRTVWLALGLGCGLDSLAADAPAPQLYWTDGNLFAIKRAPLAGGAATVVLQGENYTHLAYDPMARTLYYAIGDPVPMLYRCKPDGASHELLLTLDTHNYVRGLALDPVGGKIYWSSSDGYVAGNGKIRRANLDGTAVEDLVTGMIYPYAIALDMATGKMFWIRQEVNSIWRANLDGSNAESLIPLGANSYAFCLATDTARAHLYWTDPGNGVIGRANLDGTDSHPIAALDSSSLDAGITVDPGPQGQWRSIGGQPLFVLGDNSGTNNFAALFWADTINHQVYASALDGAGAHVFRDADPNYAQNLSVIRNWETAISVTRAPEGLRLSWNSRNGLVYRVQANTNRTDPAWTEVSGQLIATGSISSWTDTNALSATQKFYRVVKE